MNFTTSVTGKIAILALLIFLSGCSSTTFLYNRLDFIIPWYLDDYVELERDQRKQLDQLLTPFLDWHRVEELPRYLLLLDSLSASLDEPASAESIAEQTAVIETAWYRLEARGVGWLLELGEGLSDQQIAELLDHLQEDQEKYEDKYLQRDESEYHEDIYDNFLDSSQDFLGRLNRDQRGLLRDATETLRRSDEVWLQERAAWLLRLRDTLRREAGWQQRILDDMAQRDQSVSPDYSDIIEHNMAIVHQAVAELLNSRSEKQDRHLRKKLNDLREDIVTLIEQGVDDA